MSNIQPRRVNPLARALRKFFVSGFVVFTFVAYALHERFGAPATPPLLAAQPTAPAQNPAATAAAPPRATAAPAAAQAAAPTAPPPPTAAAAPTTPPPTATTAPIALANALYKDGAYSGPVTDAYYGNVQVKAVIQAGKLTDVQFIEYPNDRRTSIRINTIAMPYLINEALQAQSANVDVISGATLTSEAFAQSLQSALDTAKMQATS